MYKEKLVYTGGTR